MTIAANSWCDWCVAAGGLYAMARPCCQARWLARAPRHVRQAVYARLAADDGHQAALAMVARVKAWHRREAAVGTLTPAGDDACGTH